MFLERISDNYGIQFPSTPFDSDVDFPDVYKLIKFSLTNNSLQSLFPEFAAEWNNKLYRNSKS